MLNHYDLALLARIKQSMLLAEADQERLVRLLTSEKPGLGQRIRGRLGDWLITLGYKLKTQPIRQSDTHITRLSC